MKAVKCAVCSDGFFLHYEERRCVCGKTRGAYDQNGATAWVSGPAISIGIGNGSFHRAVQEMKMLQEVTGDKADRSAYIETGRISHAWVRPNSGPGNPHTRTEP